MDDGCSISFKKLEIVIYDRSAYVLDESTFMLVGVSNELNKRNTVLFDEE